MVSKESFQKIEPSGSRVFYSKNTDNIDKDQFVAIHYPKRHQRFWINPGDYWSFASITHMDPLTELHYVLF
jgi:hypothetical protein